ncbi:hypothetical protein BTJ40_07065 [Microbulbifer sp. A4B17]|uniref:hypothetical protein n=1 Tax=Microbulbifer sp. A4B17 TaxID=359370 RepID=UPI000D52CCDC|nr:hypothetical protein [Microbulbifer sp. A4B17]AWF80587.1 hypothetical protein BTJ40_07065 [Microbulbifer sp. A4B17]
MYVASKTAYADGIYKAGIVPNSKLLQSVISVVSEQINNPTNKPNGKELASIDTWGSSKNAKKYIEATHAALPAGGISITFIGETHGLVKDQGVARSIINNHSAADLIYYERGLNSGYGGPYANPAVATGTVREEDLTTSYGIRWGVNTFGVSPAPRDIVLAGYLVLCAASGNQNNTAKILLLSGENHVGVLHQFNEIATKAAPWLLKRKRLLHFVKSHDTCKENKWGIKKV